MAKAQHIGKLVIEMADENPIHVRRRQAPLQLQEDRSYLVTGGTRGFGFALAVRLVERGARHLILLSRTGVLDSESAHQVDSWRNAGVDVHVGAVDVGDRPSLESALSLVKKTMPPLAGVVHAAMTLADGPARELDEERMWRVLGPKAGGALNLHQLTMDQSLDWFLLLSSVSGTLGNPDQANYNAANLLVEGLATARRLQGLPTSVVVLGPLSQTGFVARNARIKERLARIGLRETPLEVALAIAEQAIEASIEHRIAARMNREAVVRYLSGTMPRFARVLPKHGSLAQASNVKDSTRTAEPSMRRKLVADAIRHAMSKMLGGSADRLPEDTPITELGVDSLVTAQLTSWLHHEMGVEISSMRLLKGPSIHELAAEVVSAIA